MVTWWLVSLSLSLSEVSGPAHGYVIYYCAGQDLPHVLRSLKKSEVGQTEEEANDNSQIFRKTNLSTEIKANFVSE